MEEHPLLAAIVNQDLMRVTELLPNASCRIRVNVPDAEPPLFIVPLCLAIVEAARHGFSAHSMEVCCLCLAKLDRENVNILSKLGSQSYGTCLFVCVKTNAPMSLCEALLNRGADVNVFGKLGSDDSERSALSVTVLKNRVELLNLMMVKAKCNFSSLEPRERGLLEVAADVMNYEMCAFVLQHLNAPPLQVDEDSCCLMVPHLKWSGRRGWWPQYVIDHLKLVFMCIYQVCAVRQYSVGAFQHVQPMLVDFILVEIREKEKENTRLLLAHSLVVGPKIVAQLRRMHVDGRVKRAKVDLERYNRRMIKELEYNRRMVKQLDYNWRVIGE